MPFTATQKLVHVVWVGPTKLKEEYIEHLLSWMYRIENVRVIFWVDKSSAPPEYLLEYPKDFRTVLPSVVFSTLFEKEIHELDVRIRKEMKLPEVSHNILKIVKEKRETESLFRIQRLIRTLLSGEDSYSDRVDDLVEHLIQIPETEQEKFLMEELSRPRLNFFSTYYFIDCFSLSSDFSKKINALILKSIQCLLQKFCDQKSDDQFDPLISQIIDEILTKIKTDPNKKQFEDECQKAFKLLASDRIIMQDISQLKGCELASSVLSAVYYSIHSPQPNYGMASDILRYLILYTQGGLYADVDVECLIGCEKNLVQLFQNCKLLGFRTDKAGDTIPNDILVCPQFNKTVLSILRSALQNVFLVPSKRMVVDAYIGDDPIYRKWLGVDSTGPTAVQKVFDEHCDKFVDLDDKHGLHWIVPNDGTWIDRWDHLKDPNLAIERAVACIDFEVTHWGILRLDYHIWAIMQSPHYTISDAEVSGKLFPKLPVREADFCKMR